MLLACAAIGLATFVEAPKNDLSISNFAMLRNASPVFLAVLFRITAPEIPLATAT
jgi:hypothetical protein